MAPALRMTRYSKRSYQFFLFLGHPTAPCRRRGRSSLSVFQRASRVPTLIPSTIRISQWHHRRLRLDGNIYEVHAPGRAKPRPSAARTHECLVSSSLGLSISHLDNPNLDSRQPTPSEKGDTHATLSKARPWLEHPLKTRPSKQSSARNTWTESGSPRWARAAASGPCSARRQARQSLWLYKRVLPYGHGGLNVSSTARSLISVHRYPHALAAPFRHGNQLVVVILDVVYRRLVQAQPRQNPQRQGRRRYVQLAVGQPMHYRQASTRLQMESVLTASQGTGGCPWKRKADTVRGSCSSARARSTSGPAESVTRWGIASGPSA